MILALYPINFHLNNYFLVLIFGLYLIAINKSIKLVDLIVIILVILLTLINILFENNFQIIIFSQVIIAILLNYKKNNIPDLIFYKKLIVYLCLLILLYINISIKDTVLPLRMAFFLDDSNFSAAIILIIFSILLIFNTSKFILIASLINITYLIFLTGSRLAILSLPIYIFLYLFHKKTLLMRLVAVSSIIATSIYSFVFEILVSQPSVQLGSEDLFDRLGHLLEDGSNYERIAANINAFKWAIDHGLWLHGVPGYFTNISLNAGFDNPHNWLADSFVRFGIIYSLILIFSLTKFSLKLQSKYLPLFSIVIIISGVLNIYILIFPLILLIIINNINES